MKIAAFIIAWVIGYPDLLLMATLTMHYKHPLVILPWAVFLGLIVP